MHPPVKLLIIDRNAANIQAAWNAFQGEDNVECRIGDINSTIGYDCLITPGNSFGIMDGGFDEVVKILFGEDIERRVGQIIEDDIFGELPVGDAVIVWPQGGHPLLCYAPTMRVPMQITRTDNVYLAMRAALMRIQQHNMMESLDESGSQLIIETVVTPMLGTGAGKMKPADAAKQMKLAWDRMKDERQTIVTWTEADALQAAIGLGHGGDPDHY